MLFGAFSLMQRGGPVMWALLLVSFFALVLFVERALFLHKGQIRTTAFLDGIKNLLRKRRRMEALTVCENTPGPVASVVKAGLLHVDASEEKLRTALQEAALVEIPILERRIGTLAALARVAPLLGMLGTVLGMYRAFHAIGTSEQASYPTFGMLLNGVAQALITTLIGLAIAILCHLAHHFLHGRIRALVQDMEYCGHQLMTFLLRELPAEQAAATDPAPPATPEGKRP